MSHYATEVCKCPENLRSFRTPCKKDILSFISPKVVIFASMKEQEILSKANIFIESQGFHLMTRKGDPLGDGEMIMLIK